MTFQAELRDALLARRAALRELAAAHQEELRRVRNDRRAEFADDEHDPEGSTLSAGWQLLEGLRRRETAELVEVDAALGRLDAGEYGRCSRCGQIIAPDRLRARPTATQCLECAGRPDRRR